MVSDVIDTALLARLSTVAGQGYPIRSFDCQTAVSLRSAMPITI